MIAPARIAAYEILRAAHTELTTLADAIDAPRSRLSDPRDQALATDIVIGTVRWQATLDHLLTRFTHRATTRLDIEVLVVLRLSAYQLLHLDRVPTAAIVNDGVNLVKRAGKRSAGGLVNATLRALARERSALDLPPRPVVGPEDPEFRVAALEFLSTSLSHPPWLAARWLDRFGFDAAADWAAFNNRPAPLTLRVNRLESDLETVIAGLASEDVEVEPSHFAPEGLVVVSGHPLATSLAATGAFLAQDEASQLVARLMRPRPGDWVLDACAAPGGKTTALAAAMGDDGTVVAIDIRDRRMRLLRRTVQRVHATSIRLVRADITERLPLRNAFDWVLLDAPCSGLGTIRRDPEIRWRRSEADLPRFAAIQHQMLTRVADVVRPGGSVVYATCSSEPDENEDVVEQFLAWDERFELVDPAADSDDLAPFIGPDRYFRTSPVAHGLEAFFGAVLRRRLTSAKTARTL